MSSPFTIGETVYYASFGKKFGIIEKLTPKAAVLITNGRRIRKKLSEIYHLTQAPFDRELLYAGGSNSDTYEDEMPEWR